MKLAIMQPYFLPYIGYFSLFYNSDEFVFFDTVQYTKKSWYERNRIIKLQGGFSYIKVPLEKVKIGTAINEVKIDNSSDWKSRILAQLYIYRKAPYYNDVINLITNTLDEDHDYLYTLNIELIKSILDYLGIQTKIHVLSRMNLDIDTVNSPDEWALNISKKMKAETYINSPGGESFFNKEKYKKSGINLLFVHQPLENYQQLNQTNELGLSILDVLMHNSKEDIIKMLDNSECR